MASLQGYGCNSEASPVVDRAGIRCQQNVANRSMDHRGRGYSRSPRSCSVGLPRSQLRDPPYRAVSKWRPTFPRSARGTLDLTIRLRKAAALTSGEVVPANARGRLARAADAAWIDDRRPQRAPEASRTGHDVARGLLRRPAAPSRRARERALAALKARLYPALRLVGRGAPCGENRTAW